MLLMKRFLQAIAVIALSGTPGCAIYIRPAPPPGAVFVRREPEYLWIPARWELPPPRMRHWVAGAWHHDRRGWFFIDGHWR